MRHKLITFAVLATTAFTGSVQAADGQVNFVGEIIDAACTVTNDLSSPLTVNLGQVSRNTFTAAGQTAAPTEFTLALTACPATVTSASVKFDGIADGGDNNILALTQDAGFATGVGIQMTDSTGTIVPLLSSSTAYPLVAGDNNLDFTARYISTAAAVTPGPANATSQFTIIYN